MTESVDDHYDRINGPLPFGRDKVGYFQAGSRLVPQSVFEGKAASYVESLREILDLGADSVTLFAFDVSRFGKDESNAVTPAWRGDNGSGPVIFTSIVTLWSDDPADWAKMQAKQTLITEVLVPAIAAITPGSGTYSNEGDLNEPNFQTAFYGSKYERLLTIKETYDPERFLYAKNGVGSEGWIVEEDGHLCRV